ncbi:P-loop containing nucleoside triphosphate hydrolase protein [Dunaliella salina]|uniref:DNA 3'-5' helicase n=1 Tax=Dunaliella salina TaxID=3046 RepID=A0ABQ7GVD7_DUNSA|nr:P-loop containing nucleoside triphosphate hydrolase protein [Dunaliella salina]|eukprot:KAF5838540.1 P-loop containing nucleoside triphosphate hydrolase protein [Dunaliella salina]
MLHRSSSKAVHAERGIPCSMHISTVHRVKNVSMHVKHAGLRRNISMHSRQANSGNDGEFGKGGQRRRSSSSSSSSKRKSSSSSSKSRSSSSSSSSRNPLGSLNHEQKAAVTDPNDAVYIKAGPGTGKTKIQHLIQSGVNPRSILAITFTNKAAGELQERVGQMSGSKAVRASTFHRICLGILRADLYNIEDLGILISKDFAIFDTNDAKDALRSAVQKQVYFEHMEPRQVTDVVNCLAPAFEVAKNLVPTTVGTNMVPVFSKAIQEEKIAIDTELPAFGFGDPRTLAKLFDLYQMELAANDAVDFTDIISFAVALLHKPRIQEHYNSKFAHILIDEFQDTNAPQFALAKLLKGRAGSLFVVGDEDQMIYGWRGTNAIKMGENFSAEWPHRSARDLSGNYRSAQVHLDAASAVLSYLGAPPNHKTLQALSGHPGAVHHVSVMSEVQGQRYESAEAHTVVSLVEDALARGIPRAEIAILYRMKFKSSSISQQLRTRGVPHIVLGKNSIWDLQMIQVAISFLRLIGKPMPSEYAFSNDLERVLSAPIGDGIGSKTIRALQTGICRERGVGFNQLILGDLLEVWMDRDELNKVMESVAKTAKDYSCDAVQGLKMKQMREHRAKQRADMDAATAPVQQLIPELGLQDLPGADVKARRAVNDLRRLFVLGRSAARFLDVKDALQVFLDAGRYRLGSHKGDKKKDSHFVELLQAAAKVEKAQSQQRRQREEQKLKEQTSEKKTSKEQTSQQKTSEKQTSELQASQQQVPPEAQTQDQTQIQSSETQAATAPSPALKDDADFSMIRGFINQTKIWQMEDDEEPGNRVRLMTIHTSKGTEYSVVIICGFQASIMPKTQKQESVDTGKRLPTDIEEEKRLAFVACTRAKENLYFIGPAPGFIDATTDNPVRPSPFTSELEMLERRQPGTIEFVQYG